MITITVRRSQFGAHYTVTAPGMDARFFTNQRSAESYAEIRSVVMDLPIERKEVVS